MVSFAFDDNNFLQRQGRDIYATSSTPNQNKTEERKKTDTGGTLAAAEHYNIPVPRYVPREPPPPQTFAPSLRPLTCAHLAAQYTTTDASMQHPQNSCRPR